MQLTADLLGRKIERPSHFDMSCLGAAFVAGLGTGKEQVTLRLEYTTRFSGLSGDVDASCR